MSKYTSFPKGTSLLKVLLKEQKNKIHSEGLGDKISYLYIFWNYIVILTRKIFIYIFFVKTLRYLFTCIKDHRCMLYEQYFFPWCQVLKLLCFVTNVYYWVGIYLVFVKFRFHKIFETDSICHHPLELYYVEEFL